MIGASQAHTSKLFLLTCLFILSSCASLPDAVSKRTADSYHGSTPPVCHDAASSHVISSLPANTTTSLDPHGFRLLNWNIHKGSKAGWQEELMRHWDGQDLVTLQEVQMDHRMQPMLSTQGLHWDFAQAFEIGGHATGVMTLARATPSRVCVQRTMEPWITLPKSTLISTFELTGNPQQLLVANVHAVNFSLGISAYRVQIGQLADVIQAHDGPVVVAGDFNTWSGTRIAFLERQLIDQLALKKVDFDQRPLTRIFGIPLDHVYYRGLIVTRMEVQQTPASDHNPMWVGFQQTETDNP